MPLAGLDVPENGGFGGSAGDCGRRKPDKIRGGP